MNAPKKMPRSRLDCTTGTLHRRRPQFRRIAESKDRAGRNRSPRHSGSQAVEKNKGWNKTVSV